MKRLPDLNAADAKERFLKDSSHFNGDFPNHISFEPILKNVAEALAGEDFPAHKKKGSLSSYSNVNHSFVANKDGRFAWRPYELMHPADSAELRMKSAGSHQPPNRSTLGRPSIHRLTKPRNAASGSFTGRSCRTAQTSQSWKI